jgi:Tol biopolymer transport system component
MIRATFLVAGLCLLGLIGVHSERRADFYSIYYVETANYEESYGTLYKIPPQDLSPQPVSPQDMLVRLEDVSSDWILYSAVKNDFEAERTQELYRLSTHGNTLQKLPIEASYIECARFSDNGQWIIYETREGTFRRMQVDGTDDQLLIEAETYYGDCRGWDTQGDWIALQHYDGTKGMNMIYRLHLDGTDFQVLNNQHEFFPLLSSNAQWVVTFKEESLTLRSSDGRITYTIPDSAGTDGQYRFSPDNQWLVFQFYDALNGYYELAALYLPDLTRHNLTQNIEASTWLPAFLPDTDWVVFMADNPTTGFFDVYKVNYDGTALTLLMNEAWNDWAMAISPDNLWLLVNSGSSTQSGLYLLRVDGKYKKRLTTSPVVKDVYFVPETATWHREYWGLTALLAIVGAGWRFRRQLDDFTRPIFHCRD